jgi:hypothetical protein
METILKIMVGINVIGFLYRLNNILFIHFENIYPLLLIIYREIYYIILAFIILYLIVKIIQIHNELKIIKEILIKLLIQITELNNILIKM